jgi:hypothetical protein
MSPTQRTSLRPIIEFPRKMFSNSLEGASTQRRDLAIDYPEMWRISRARQFPHKRNRKGWLSKYS